MRQRVRERESETESESERERETREQRKLAKDSIGENTERIEQRET